MAGGSALFQVSKHFRRRDRYPSPATGLIKGILQNPERGRGEEGMTCIAGPNLQPKMFHYQSECYPEFSV